MNIWLETEAKNNLKNLIKTCKINGNSIFVLCDDNSAKFCLPTIEDCADEMFFDNLIVIPQGEDVHAGQLLAEAGSSTHSSKAKNLICFRTATPPFHPSDLTGFNRHSSESAIHPIKHVYFNHPTVPRQANRTCFSAVHVFILFAY